MNAPAAPLSGRLLWVDAYRGFIMLAMVSAGLGTAQLRKDPQWSHLSWFTDQLEHVDWYGCTFWDLIQPSFMFMVGVSMPFAFAKRQERGESWKRQFFHVMKRCFLLCFIGILMDSFGTEVIHVQFIRVLQQIAIGYFIAFFFLKLGWKGQLAGVVLLLGAHNLAYYWYGNWDTHVWNWENRENNVGWKIDCWMHEPFQGLKYFDILPPSRGRYATINAVSAAATILIGVLAGGLLKCPRSSGVKCLALLLGGAALFGSGFLLEHENVQPLVKHLWNTSFALYAAGWTCWMLLFFYVLIDIFGWRGWALPFVVVGVNSIFIYFCSDVLAGHVRNPQTIRLLLKPFTWHLLAATGPLGPWGPVVMASLVTFVLWLLCLFLYRHRIFFKV